MMNGISYFKFHTDLRGYEFISKTESVPKFILYLKGFTPESLLTGKTKYKPKERV